MKNFHKILKELCAFKRIIPLFIVISANFNLFAPPPCMDLAVVPDQPMLLPNLEGQNLYQILGVARNATEDQIKKAYKAKAAEWHPDKNGNTDESKKKFQKLGEAYKVLTSPNLRAAYDKGEYKQTDPEKPKVVPYEERFTGTKVEADQKLYQAFKEVCRKNGFEWHETDDFWMFVCYLHFVQNDLNPDQFSLWLRKRASGVFHDEFKNHHLADLFDVKEVEEYFEYDGDNVGFLAAKEEAFKAAFKYLTEMVDPSLTEAEFRLIHQGEIEKLRKLYKHRDKNKQNMDTIIASMVKDRTLLSDSKFKDLAEGSKEQAIAEFLDALQNRRNCLSNPNAAIPTEMKNMPEETDDQKNEKIKVIRSFLIKNLTEQVNIFKDNFGRTFSHKIGSLFSLITGGVLLIFAGIKGAKGFYDMKNFNKAKRREKRKTTPKMILKSIALPTGLGLGFLILRWFILYQKSQVKLSGGFDTTIDWTA